MDSERITKSVPFKSWPDRPSLNRMALKCRSLPLIPCLQSGMDRLLFHQCNRRGPLASPPFRYRTRNGKEIQRWLYRYCACGREHAGRREESQQLADGSARCAVCRHRKLYASQSSRPLKWSPQTRYRQDLSVFVVWLLSDLRVRPESVACCLSTYSARQNVFL